LGSPTDMREGSKWRRNGFFKAMRPSMATISPSPTLNTPSLPFS
jgi:hypothetical protein